MQSRVRGILIVDGSIVLIKRVKPQEINYVFPGGGVENGESETSALQREMREELSVDVEVGEKFMENRTDLPNAPLEIIYLCKRLRGQLGIGGGPEFQNDGSREGVYIVIEVPLRELSNLDVRPVRMRDEVAEKLSRS